MNLSIMKVEAVVSGVMRAVTINCESILPGLIVLKARLKTFSIVLTRVYHAVTWPNSGVANFCQSIYSNKTVEYFIKAVTTYNIRFAPYQLVKSSYTIV